MFYICPKCRRRWQYPLPECPYDFSAIEPMEGVGARVSSVSKVMISTLFHPDVPYYILLLKDEHNNTWAHKSEVEYKAGDEFKILPNNDPEAVAIWRVKFDIKDAVKKAVDLIGGAAIKPDSKIVILPTLSAPSHEYFRDNTSKGFLEAVLLLLADAGINSENIVVGSQSFDEMPIAAAAQKSGLLALLAKHKITPVDFAGAEFIKTGKFEIAKPVFEADLIINLAMEKIGKASATKNMFCVLKKENYLGLKYLSSDAEIAAGVEPLLKNMITVGEAENIQRSNKQTTFVGLVLASRKPRNLDCVFNEIVQSLDLPEIAKDCNIKTIPIAGRSIKEVQYKAEIY